VSWKDVFKILLPILLDYLSKGQATAALAARPDLGPVIDVLLKAFGDWLKELLAK